MIPYNVFNVKPIKRIAPSAEAAARVRRPPVCFFIRMNSENGYHFLKFPFAGALFKAVGESARKGEKVEQNIKFPNIRV